MVAPDVCLPASLRDAAPTINRVAAGLSGAVDTLPPRFGAETLGLALVMTSLTIS